LFKLLEVIRLEKAQWKAEVREHQDLHMGELDRGGFLGDLKQTMSRDRLPGHGGQEGRLQRRETAISTLETERAGEGAEPAESQGSTV
jgi:hypothetical protein